MRTPRDIEDALRATQMNLSVVVVRLCESQADMIEALEDDRFGRAIWTAFMTFFVACGVTEGEIEAATGATPERQRLWLDGKNMPISTVRMLVVDGLVHHLKQRPGYPANL